LGIFRRGVVVLKVLSMLAMTLGALQSRGATEDANVRQGPNQHQAGWLAADHRMVGAKSGLMEEFVAYTANHPEVLRFAQALYTDRPDCKPESTGDRTPARWKIFTPELADEAEVIMREMVLGRLQPYAVSATEIFDHANWSGVETSLQSNKWMLHVAINDKVQQNTDQSRVYVVPHAEAELHEMSHIERVRGGQSLDLMFKKDFQMVMALELGPTLTEILAADETYKQIYSLPLQAEVNYDGEVPSSTGHLTIGHIANEFRELLNRYPQIEAAIMSEEGQAFIRQYYSSECN
jgi:hypothetical protein